MWELNSGPMRELPMLLTAEPYLQPQGVVLKLVFFTYIIILFLIVRVFGPEGFSY